jgi:signal transduction histidine kinase
VRPEQWLEHIHPDDQTNVREQWQKALTDPQSSMAVEFRLCRPDGQVVWIFAQALPEVRTHASVASVQSVVGTFSDMTSRKQLEHERINALSQAAQTQEQRIQDADAHRQDLLAFVDMVCHEIRNPLNGLVNSVDTLLEHKEAIAGVVANDLHDSNAKQQLSKIVSEQQQVFEAMQSCLSHQVCFFSTAFRLFFIAFFWCR